VKRYFFEISYRGTKYFGWQRQPRSISVQQELEETIGKLYSNEIFPIVGCGRTDTGVHAKQYFFHIDLPEIDSLEKMVFKLNRMLSDDIVVHFIGEVDSALHARFSATQRTYRYFIHHQKDPFKTDNSWYFPQDLNYSEMNKAAKALLGTQDFTSLSKLHTDVKTNICTLTKAEWVMISDTESYFEITADRFLRNMVRATVGTLIDVGLGKIAVSEIKGILEAKDRSAASTSVPAHGLFLWKIEY